MSATAPDFAAIKQRQQATWAAGDYAQIGTRLQLVGERLAEALDLRAGERVLDVCAGNGNAALAAARHFCEVTASDYVPALLARAQARAEADGLPLDTREADAEALPFADASFDVVTSTFGVMFTPNQEKAAAEMLRVCRPGGRIGLANWTPDSFIGQLFRTIGRHVPPPAGIRSPALWGTAARLAELFPDQRVETRERIYTFRFHSPEHWLEVFRTWYGPTNRAFAALDAAGQARLAADILDLLSRHDRSGDTLVVPSDYLEVVIRRS